MKESDSSLDGILKALQERAKELNCLYRVDEILSSREITVEDAFGAVVEALPAGWQYPSLCRARIVFRGQPVQPADFAETPWIQSASILIQGEPQGSVSLVYSHAMPESDEGPFLKEERKLISAVADRLAQFVLHRELAAVFEHRAAQPTAEARPAYAIVLDLLRRTDPGLYQRIARKMLNRLSVLGMEEAQRLLASFDRLEAASPDENQPQRRIAPQQTDAEATFALAASQLSEQEVLSSIHVWIKEDRVSFLVQALESSYTSLVEIANVLERYQHTGVESHELTLATQMGLKVALIRRLLTDHSGFINTCRKYVEIEDFLDLIHHTVILPKSHGRLGGKSSGLFLATQIIKRSREFADVLDNVRTPKTWYLPSDGIVQFMSFNNLDDVYNWRYRDLDQIRQEYPHLLAVFKSSRFPTEIVNGLSAALDDLGDRPLIVRSSSLLEDRVGSAFSGKYKSLFLANQGEKQARLAALLDAVAEVYASVFGPDPIQYRAERGLLEHHEEMGIMIQEVVGTRVGRYYLPAFAGVGFSNNEFRWSPRIKREDGLLRMVPGLGTRAVDRLADDYPVLVAPGQPGLRVNVSPDEIVRYSPRKVDVINLATGSFETIEARRLLEEAGPEIPRLELLVSVVDHDRVRRPSSLDLLQNPRSLVFTFDGLTTSSPFMARMKSLLTLLREALGTPVDIEFASDGRDFYLLQCRPQSDTLNAAPASIPRDIPHDHLVFSAHRYVSNGHVPDITHVVYVDPDAYASLPSLEAMREVGRAVSALNALLPKRQFLLVGPGRWGSRGDIKLGVAVTYSDINNTAALIEVARKRGNYVPDLSFGTHFFQDLVEAGIRYLPLYPDDSGVVFNEAFLARSPNVLADLLPAHAQLAPVVRVIDVPQATGGNVLRLLMNADLDEALAFLAPPGATEPTGAVPGGGFAPRPAEDHWRWRMRMAQRIATDLEATRFGVKALYVFGSTKNATAGPGSDIDLIVHFGGSEAQRQQLGLWLQGWSLCLAEMNYLRAGYRSDGLLDVQYVTDDDIARQTSYAVKIGAITDAARPLTLGPHDNNDNSHRKDTKNTKNGG